MDEAELELFAAVMVVAVEQTEVEVDVVEFAD